jgi:hypothetical protein
VKTSNPTQYCNKLLFGSSIFPFLVVVDLWFTKTRESLFLTKNNYFIYVLHFKSENRMVTLTAKITNVRTLLKSQFESLLFKAFDKLNKSRKLNETRKYSTLIALVSHLRL